jgi:tetratricopeptide (TPR) repeat protein
MYKIKRFIILFGSIAIISNTGCSAKFDNSRVRSLNIEARKYHDLGLQLSRENRIDDAIAAYTKSIEINPSAGAYNGRSAEYIRMGAYDMAISDANQAIFLNYKYPMPYFNRGNAYFKKKDFDSALKNYSRAIALDPGQAEFYFNRGLAHARMGQDDKALESYERAIKINPRNVSAYYNMACIYSEKNEAANSLSCLEKAVSEGFSDAARMKQEAALRNVSSTPRFRALLKKLEKKRLGGQ